MKGVDAVAKILKQEGVEFLFSYPNHPVIDAAAKLGIRPIIARSEKTLINIADGYSRATNGQKPAVVVVQAGPGIENAFGGVAQAYADSIPLLLIPGGPDQRHGGTGEFDPLPTYKNVTKWAARIGFPEHIPTLMHRAFTQVRSGHLRPVLLELPRDVGSADVDESKLDYQTANRYRSAGDPNDVAEVARMIAASRRPVIHAGHGVLWAEAWDELRELAELIQAPVMTTMAGKSAFPEDHPLSLGAGGHTITRAAAQFLVKSDLVLGVGSSFARSAFAAPIPPGKKLVQIVVDPAALDRDYVVDQAVIGDAKLVLRQLIDELRRRGSPNGRSGDDVTAEIRQAKEAERREWSPRLTSDETPINPYRVISDLMNAVDRRNTVVTHDSGNPRDQTLTFFETLIPRGYLGWGKSTQLGTGYGLALGAKLAHPDRLVINIMGDLAFGTAGMEVETAVRERIPIMTVLLNNSVMGGYGHHMPTASERFGANRLSGSYARVAEGLGAYAERVERPGDVTAAIKRGVAATQEGRPVLLEMITKEEPVYPAAPALINELAKELAQPVG